MLSAVSAVGDRCNAWAGYVRRAGIGLKVGSCAYVPSYGNWTRREVRSLFCFSFAFFFFKAKKQKTATILHDS